MFNGKVVFIRHANFFKPVAGAYYGHSDLPLTPGGEMQARNLAKLLPMQEEGIQRVYCSDLSRAHRTAELALPGDELIDDPGLREMNFGKWEGRTYAQIKDEDGFSAFLGGSAAPEGESEAQFGERVVAALDAILAAEEGTIAIVAHAGSIRIMIAHMLGLSAENAWRFQIDTASISTVTVSEGYGYLSALNVRPTLFISK